jgi:hypothetical protein
MGLSAICIPGNGRHLERPSSSRHDAGSAFPHATPTVPVADVSRPGDFLARPTPDLRVRPGRFSNWRAASRAFSSQVESPDGSENAAKQGDRAPVLIQSKPNAL